eukprot:194613-Amphidinium_carterae.1
MLRTSWRPIDLEVFERRLAVTLIALSAIVDIVELEALPRAVHMIDGQTCTSTPLHTITYLVCKYVGCSALMSVFIGGPQNFVIVNASLSTGGRSEKRADLVIIMADGGEMFISLVLHSCTMRQCDFYAAVCATYHEGACVYSKKCFLH